MGRVDGEILPALHQRRNSLLRSEPSGRSPPLDRERISHRYNQKVDTCERNKHSARWPKGRCRDAASSFLSQSWWRQLRLADRRAGDRLCVGRKAGASTNVKVDAQILSHSRSRGLFAGLELKGVVIEPDKDDMLDVYGEGVIAKEVLEESEVKAPAAVGALPATSGRYDTGRAER